MFVDVWGRARKKALVAIVAAFVALIAVAIAQATGPSVSGKSASIKLPADSDTHAVAAKCSGNDKVIGGGVKNQDALSDQIAGSYPTRRGKWTSLGFRFSSQGSTDKTTSYARCLSSGSVKIRTKKAQLAESGEADAAVAKCKSGEQLLGGGARLSDPLDDYFEGSYPTGGAGWKAVGVTYSSQRPSITSYALCSKHVTTRQTSSTTTMDGNDLYSAKAKCPDHFAVSGGGVKVSAPEVSYVSGTYPKGSSWVAKGQQEGPPSKLTAYAICLK